LLSVGELNEGDEITASHARGGGCSSYDKSYERSTAVVVIGLCDQCAVFSAVVGESQGNINCRYFVLQYSRGTMLVTQIGGYLEF